MALARFLRITEYFGGTIADEATRRELFKEALLLALSRATSSDINIAPVEVDTVIDIVKEATGEEVSAADVRVAARSELYETASLDDYLAVVGRKLAPEERSTIVRSLAKVLKSDERISPREIDFFNWVVSALRATPAEISGLIE